MAFIKDIIHQNCCITSVLACILLTMAYVASLYVWRSNLSRDHPSTIKRRFFSVTCMMVASPFICEYFFTENTLKRGTLYEHLGLRYNGILQATVFPLLLTVALFLGPLTMQCLSGIWKLYSQPTYWWSSWQDLVWVRNHFMAPLSEEWVFRACMLPLLLQCLKPMSAVFIGPLLFGIAHFHHMFEQMNSGFDFKTALMISMFQFTYTSLFGAYSAYLFLRTGHFVAPLVAHIFCNHMGFPNFAEVVHFPPVERFIIILNFLLGFAIWCVMLVPITEPDLYYNTLHWDSTIVNG